MIVPVVRLLPRVMEIAQESLILIPKSRIGFVQQDWQSVPPHVKVNGFHINRETPDEARQLQMDIRRWLNWGTVPEPVDPTPVDSQED